METENIVLEMNAARVCDAIAKIGYSPTAALMDIVDNAVAAGATRIVVALDKNPDKTLAANDNVLAYRVAIGLILSTLATRLVRSMLYGVEPRDPAILGGTVVLLLAVSTVAGWLPAWRASRIDPAEVLRYA